MDAENGGMGKLQGSREELSEKLGRINRWITTPSDQGWA